MIFTLLFCIIIDAILLSQQAQCLHGQSSIIFQNNGYSGIVIAIQDSVSEDITIIDKLQTILNDASRFLYKATRKRAYFKEIDILVPATWSNPQFLNANSQTLQNADIVITNSRSLPATKNYAGCGQQGIRIQTNTDFILNNKGIPYYGRPDKFLIHEWAKFRWGVFEEYPSPGENPFYFSTQWGRPDAVKCTALLKGRQTIRYPNGTMGYCLHNTIDVMTGLLPEGCEYTPYPWGNTLTTASLMDHQYIREVVDFCDDSGDYRTQHNREPPNRQNRLCGHRSVWTVITNTGDFAGGVNPPRNLIDAQLLPTVRVYRASRKRRSAVIINVHKKDRTVIEKLYQTVAHFILNADEDNEYVIVHNASQKARVIRSPDGRTKAMRMLTKANFDLRYNEQDKLVKRVISSRSVNYIIVVSNNGFGEKEGFSAGYKILTVKANRENQEQQTYKIFNEMKHPFHIGFGGHVETAYSIMESVIGHEHVQLFSNTTALNSDEMYCGTFVYDGSLSGSCIFYATSHGSVSLNSLVSPSGRRYGDHSVGFQNYRRFGIIRLEVEGEAGLYTFCLKGKSQNSTTTVVILAKQRKYVDLEPIRQRALSKLISQPRPPRFGIFAEVSKGDEALTDVNVTAIVTKHGSHCQSSLSIQLYDNGAGADIHINDGIYSRFFTHFTGPGHYDIKVVISGYQHLSGTGNFFNRTTNAGYIILRAQTDLDNQWMYNGHAMIDRFPPFQITDLEANSLEQNMTVTLSWTATGDDLDYGTVTLSCTCEGMDISRWRMCQEREAARYDLKYGPRGNELLDYPNNAVSVSQTNIVHGSLSHPKAAGQKEEIKISFPSLISDEKVTLAFRIRAVDDVGNVGEYSNLVTVGL